MTVSGVLHFGCARRGTGRVGVDQRSVSQVHLQLVKNIFVELWMWPARKNKEHKIIVHGQGRFSPIRGAETSLAGQRSNICLFLPPPGRFMNSHLFSKDCWESTKAPALTMEKRVLEKTFVQLPRAGPVAMTTANSGDTHLFSSLFLPSLGMSGGGGWSSCRERWWLLGLPFLHNGAQRPSRGHLKEADYFGSLCHHTETAAIVPFALLFRTQAPSSDAAVTAQFQGPYLLPLPATELSFSHTHRGPWHFSKVLSKGWNAFSLEPWFL